MERPTSNELEPRDTTLLSMSGIGSPTAFSTAIKPPGSLLHQPSPDSSLVSHNLLAQLPQVKSQSSGEVTGRLSLGSVSSEKGASNKDGSMSLNDTSVGILDLDAMQDSSTNLFLTSPFGSKDLHLHLSTMSSLPSVQPSSMKAPTVDGTVLDAVDQRTGVSNLAGYVPNANLTEENVPIEKSVHIPQELLGRMSAGSEFSSQCSFDDEDVESGSFGSQASLSVAAVEGGGDDDNTAPKLGTSPQIEPYSELANGDGTLEEESMSKSVDHSLPLDNSSLLSADAQTHSVELQHSVGDSECTKDHSVTHGDSVPLNGQYFVSTADETLIGDLVEPSVMREADEFSQFDPTHLMSMLNQDSQFLSSRPPPVTTEGSGQESHTDSRSPSLPVGLESERDGHGRVKMDESDSPGNRLGDVSVTSSSTASEEYVSAVSERTTPNPASTDLEGLPLAYLASTSLPTDTSTSMTQYETSELASFAKTTLPSPTPQQTADEVVTAVSSRTTLQSSSLASSLTELAGALGSKVDYSQLSGGTVNVNGQVRLDTSQKNGSGMYNPFDSDDNASVGSFSQADFGEPSSDDFLAQLVKDEESINKMNLTMPTSEQQQMSFDVATGSCLGDTGNEVSITSYFQQRSHKMGELSNDKPPPSERPRFSDTASHVIQSPPDINLNAPLSTSLRDDTPTTKEQDKASRSLPHSQTYHTRDGPLDSTLVPGEQEVVSNGVSPPPTTSQVGAATYNWTPQVTVHTPFPVQFQIPKLNLADTSSQSTTVVSAESEKLSPVLSITLSKTTPSQTNPQLIQTPTKSVAATTASKSGDLQRAKNERLSTSLDSRLSTGSDCGLPSRYLKSATDSTLMFPEMSALSSFSHNFDLDSFGSMPTPSIGRLPPGFDVTEVTHPEISFSSGYGGEDVSLKSDHKSESPLTIVTEQSDKKPNISPAVYSSHTTPPSALQSSTMQSATPVTQSTHSTPVKSTETVSGSSKSPRTSLSPKTDAARQKLASLQSTLDTARFDAEAFLAGLKSSSSPVRRQEAKVTLDSVNSQDTKATETVREAIVTKPPLAMERSGPLRVEDLLMKTSPLFSTKEGSVTCASASATTRYTLTQSLPIVSKALGTELTRTHTTPVITTVVNISTSPRPISSELTKTKPLGGPHKQPPMPPVSAEEPKRVETHITSETAHTSKSPTFGSPAPRDVDRPSLSRPRKPHMTSPLSAAKKTTSSPLSSTRKTTSPHSSTKKKLRTSDSFTPPRASKLSPSPKSTPKKGSSEKQTKEHSSPRPFQTSPKPEHRSAAQMSLVESPLPPPHTLSSSQSNLQFSETSRPIYTSPPSHPHTITSPTRKTNFQVSELSDRRTPGKSYQGSVVSPKSLKVPDSLCFGGVCCVGTSLCDQLVIANQGERWLQLSFTVTQLYRDGADCSSDEQKAFLLPQRCFISPEKTESVKVMFLPQSAGNYEAVLSVFARLVVSEQEPNHPVATIILKALAERPKLEIQTLQYGSVGGSGHLPPPPVLDYGVLVGGTSVSLPLKLTNRGAAPLPLRLSITSQVALSQLCFSFGDMPQSLLPTSPPPTHVQSSYLHSLSLVLPPRQTGQTTLDYHTINVRFSAPKKYFDSSTGDPGPPEEISAVLDVTVDSPHVSGSKLISVPLRAIVGVAQLHVPRSLQAISLSCTAGQAVTREVPFKNAGNIPLKVRLKVSSDVPDTLSLKPDFLLMEPREESQIQVSFSPPSAPLSVEGHLTVHVEPSGPNYELKLRGTAIEQETQKEGLLSCNKRMLYWSGIQLNNSCQQKLVLHNGYATKVPLRLSIRHPDSNFQLQPIVPSSASRDGTHSYDVEILPQEQLPIHVVFTPTSTAVCLSALDITDLLHSKKYRIRLCGYGGSSEVEVMNARKSPHGYWVDLGEMFVGQQSTSTISLYNSGLRAAFVKATCYPDKDNSSPLSLSHASVTPSELVIPAQTTGEMRLVFNMSGSVSPSCPSPLACLRLVTGDEMVRQRLCRVCSGGTSRQGDGPAVRELTNPDNNVYLKTFKHQDSVPTELEFSSLEVEDEEHFFEQHLTKITISLSGSLPAESPLNRGKSLKPGGITFDLSPPRQKILSPSHTPPVFVDRTQKQSPTLQGILTAHTLTLPDTTVGHYSEKCLEIHNPYSAPLRWHLSSVASPFLRNSGGREAGATGEIFKANYSAFWVNERRGTVLPQCTTKLAVIFQPHDQGSFSQIWDLHVSTGEMDNKRLRLSFGGKAMKAHRPVSDPQPAAQPSVTVPVPAAELPKTSKSSHDPALESHDSRAQHVSRWLTQTQAHMPFTAVPSSQSVGALTHTPVSKKTTPPRRSIYLKDEEVDFPNTRPGAKSTVKVRVCNRDNARYKFDVIKPVAPFKVDHHTFELGTRQCARLPVHFAPSQPGRYEGVLALRTNAGHQAFAILRGKSS